MIRRLNIICFALSVLFGIRPFIVNAEKVEYKDGEISVRVTPGEPTQVQFPGIISGGFKKKLSSLSLDRKENDLIIFASEGIPENGEAIIVRLTDGRSYSVRIKRATAEHPRDDVVTIKDERGALVAASEEEDPPHVEKKFDYAPPTQVSGLMREMILAIEFGKNSIAGYQVSDRHSGEVVLADGTLRATVDRIFIGPNLWGYVINAENLLEQGQKIDPASFRIDGTRAISATNWELSPRPYNIEQQISGKDKTKIYIITRAKKTQ